MVKGITLGGVRLKLIQVEEDISRKSEMVPDIGDLKHCAKVALLGFSQGQRNGFWQFCYKLFWQWKLFWQKIGSIQNYTIEYLELPWSEEEFLLLSLEQQRQVFFRFLTEAKKRGAVVGGLPMEWRSILGKKAPIWVPDGKTLAIFGVLQKLDVEVQGIAHKEIAIIGVEETWQSHLIDQLLLRQAKPILTGRRGKEMADWYFKKKGIAIPVLRASKSLSVAAGSIFLQGTLPNKKLRHAVIFREEKIGIRGEWQQPFENGRFPAGLAAALLEVGAQSTDDLAVWQESSAIV